MEKSRLIILTDIGPWAGEPDDAQSLVRLMLYANEYDIEGIIPNASWCGPDTSDQGYMQRIIDVVKAYGRVRGNLSVHADEYPTEDYLLSVVRRGTTYVNMTRESRMETFRKLNPAFENRESLCANPEAVRLFLEYVSGCREPNVGEGLSNDGSRLIIDALKKEDPRPLWICCWGGVGTLAQALYDIQQSSSKEETAFYCRKLRVYDIDGQDDCGAWICHQFPEIQWMRSDISFWGFSETPMKTTELFGENCFVGDLGTVSEDWIKENIQSKGDLGRCYPLAHYGLETDSPSFLNHVRNGLSDPERIHWGGWGGRHTFVKSQNPPAEHFTGTFLYEQRPFYMHRDDVDTWFDEHNNKLMKKNPWASIARWRKDYQPDMAARMLWSVSGNYGDCNHNPVVVLNGDNSKDAVMVNVKRGDMFRPDISGTFDPDGDVLFYHWYVYPEAGTYRGNVDISGDDSPSPEIHVPNDAVNDEIHVILEVSDKGKGFPLKSYRRLVLRTGETGLEGRQMVVNDTGFVYQGSWSYKTDQYGSHDGDVHVSDRKGSTASLEFSGSRIMLYGGAFHNNGIAAVSIDDKEEVLVDFYSQIKPWKNKYDLSAMVTTGDTLQYVSPYLEPGKHVVTIRVIGEKCADSTGCHIVIDRAVVFF